MKLSILSELSGGIAINLINELLDLGIPTFLADHGLRKSKSSRLPQDDLDKAHSVEWTSGSPNAPRLARSSYLVEG
jgi:hypothetical protein